MFKNIRNSALASLVLGFSLFAPMGANSYAATLKDIEGHWAQQPIQQWVDKQYVKGYQDGTFKPNSGITRAEFMTMANRALGVSEKTIIQFSDVSTSQWFYEEVSKAQAAGYITGYADGTMKPNKMVSRQEVAVMLSKMANLDSSQTSSLSFKDASQILSWSKGAIGQVVAKGLMNGYPDQSFQAAKSITRAEAIATLNKLIKPEEAVTPASPPQPNLTYDQAGTYGPATGTETRDGKVTIAKAGVTLQNTIISGDLIIASSVGEGEVYLQNVTVKGSALIQGGGTNSVYVKDSSLGKVVVDKKQGNVRIVASGKSNIERTELKSGAKLEEKDLNQSGFKDVVITSNLPKDATVSLSASIGTLEVQSTQAKIEVTSGTITNLTTKSGAKENQINLANGTKVVEMTLEAPATIKGQGTIEQAKVNSPGVTFEKAPVTTNGSVTPAVGGGGPASSNTMPAASNMSLSGASFSGSGTGYTVSVSKGTQIKYLTTDINMPAEIELVSLRNHQGGDFMALLPATKARVQMGTQQSIDLIQLLGMSQLDNDNNGISAGKISTLLNGSETGSITLTIKLTKVDNNTLDTTKTTTYSLTVNITN